MSSSERGHSTPRRNQKPRPAYKGLKVLVLLVVANISVVTKRSMQLVQETIMVAWRLQRRNLPDGLLVLQVRTWSMLQLHLDKVLVGCRMLLDNICDKPIMDWWVGIFKG